MSDDLLIGKTSFDRGFSPRNKTFYIQEGDNIYRVLPPMHSLAKTGKYAQFHQTHLMKKSDGKWTKFASNEEIEWEGKNKKIVVADPINEKYSANMETYKMLKEKKDKGEVTEDQVKSYYDTNVRPLQPEKKYYVNAVSLDNQVSVLALPITAFKALDELMVRLKEEKGLDATDLEQGVFFNIHRTGTGRSTQFSVEVKREPVQDPNTGEILERYKRLPIGPELMKQVKEQARDLASLFKKIPEADMQAIADANPNERGEILSRLFTRPEKEESNKSEDTVSAPGVDGVRGVSSVNVDGVGNMNVETPNFPEQDAPKSEPAEETAAKPAEETTESSSKVASDSAISDEEFNKMFLGK